MRHMRLSAKECMCLRKLILQNIIILRWENYLINMKVDNNMKKSSDIINEQVLDKICELGLSYEVFLDEIKNILNDECNNNTNIKR